MTIQVVIKAAEFRILRQEDEGMPTCYTLENELTHQILDGALQPDELMSKLIRLSSVRLPEVQV